MGPKDKNYWPSVQNRVGSNPIVTLKEAKENELENRLAIEQGLDPRERVDCGPTFEQVVAKIIQTHEPNWKNGARSAEIWGSCLDAHAMPMLEAGWRFLLVGWTTYDPGLSTGY